MKQNSSMLIDAKVKYTEECIVQFLPNQPIQAVCCGIRVDIFGRITYDCELLLTENEDYEKRERTIIEGVSPAYIFPISE